MELLKLNVRRLLKEQGRTITWLAERLGVSQPCVSGWLCARDSMRIDTAQRIADALGVSIGDLFAKPIERRKKIRQTA